MTLSVIFDIDGTLADITARRRHLLQEPKNWAAFNAEVGNDIPVAPIIQLAQVLADAGHVVLLCSGREAVFRPQTESWLLHHQVPYHGLWMRAAKDYRADDIIKSELLDQILAEGFKPWLVVDDRDRVVKMWRDRGLTCLQCAEGAF